MENPPNCGTCETLCPLVARENRAIELAKATLDVIAGRQRSRDSIAAQWEQQMQEVSVTNGVAPKTTRQPDQWQRFNASAEQEDQVEQAAVEEKRDLSQRTKETLMRHCTKGPRLTWGIIGSKRWVCRTPIEAMFND